MGIVGRVFALGLSTCCRSGETDRLEDTDDRDGIVGTVVRSGLDADVEAEGYADGGGIDTRLLDDGGGGGGAFSLASGGRDGSGAVGGVPAGEGDREPRRKLSLVGVAEIGDLREVLRPREPYPAVLMESRLGAREEDCSSIDRKADVADS